MGDAGEGAWCVGSKAGGMKEIQVIEGKMGRLRGEVRLRESGISSDDEKGVVEGVCAGLVSNCKEESNALNEQSVRLMRDQSLCLSFEL